MRAGQSPPMDWTDWAKAMGRTGISVDEALAHMKAMQKISEFVGPSGKNWGNWWWFFARTYWNFMKHDPRARPARVLLATSVLSPVVTWWLLWKAGGEYYTLPALLGAWGVMAVVWGLGLWSWVDMRRTWKAWDAELRLYGKPE